MIKTIPLTWDSQEKSLDWIDIWLIWSQVSDLKAQIEKEHDYPVDKQKLIAYGKVMDDNDKTLKDYKIVEGGFVVLMVQ